MKKTNTESEKGKVMSHNNRLKKARNYKHKANTTINTVLQTTTQPSPTEKRENTKQPNPINLLPYSAAFISS